MNEKRMTWNEFKEYIEQRMLNQNISKNTEIGFIDVINPVHKLSFNVPRIATDDGRLEIWA